MTDSQTRSAAFVRGFFSFLESRQVRSAVLHGGADGFERELSDVDFVVDGGTFPQLPARIDEYCAQAGWLLCQVLRHETTAAYFVCSAVDDPACSVALDACSDYQRNGSVFLRAETFLQNRQALAWGGHRLSPANELRYRFCKAAAKNKPATTCAAEFAAYPEAVRREAGTWLDAHWGCAPRSWEANDLVPALAALRKKTNARPSLTQPGAVRRIASRIVQPTGLIVLAGHDNFDATAARLERAFGHLYFRHFRKAGRFRPTLLMDLVASSLIVVPDLGALWSSVLPASCIHQLNPTHEPESQCRELAQRLHERCKRRETR